MALKIFALTKRIGAKGKILLVLGCFNLVLILWIGSVSRQWIINSVPTENKRFGQYIASNFSRNLTQIKLVKLSYDVLSSDPETRQSGRAKQGFLSCMTRGQWLKRTLTNEEQSKVDRYLQEARGAFKIPRTFQREDGRCGDVPYEGSPLYRHMWFKAICNPKGGTPCCKGNRCVSLSEEQCQCPTCYDERLAIHAEFAKWEPENKACETNDYSTTKACELLRGSTISFVGDSFIRHVFVALVILLTGDIQDGALRENLASYQRLKCAGWHQITGLICRELLIEQRTLCGGTVKVDYTQVFPALQLPVAIPVLQSNRQNKKSLFIFGLGIHNDFRADDVIKLFLKPFLNIDRLLQQRSTDIGSIIDVIKTFKTNIINDDVITISRKTILDKNYGIRYRFQDNITVSYDPSEINAMAIKLNSTFNKNSASNQSQSSKVNSSQHPNLVLNRTSSSTSFTSSNLLWVGTHAPGVLKAPKFTRQTYTGVLSYNQEIHKLLHRWGVPYLDAFAFSKGTVSYDGTHYGWGINMLKVNMILTYIEKRLKHDAWRDSSD